MHLRLRPFGQARAGGWGGRGRSSCRATDAAIKPEARAQTQISLSVGLTLCNDFGGSWMQQALAWRGPREAGVGPANVTVNRRERWTWPLRVSAGLRDARPTPRC